MEQIHKYNTNTYNFYNIIQPIFNEQLNNLHLTTDVVYDVPTELGTDSATEFHDLFYKTLNAPSKWNELRSLYKSFVKDVVAKVLKSDEFLYQTFPTFRVQLPNNTAVSSWHSDGDVDNKHPPGEINFIIPLTDCFDTNTVWAESEPGLKDFHPINMKYGDLLQANFNECLHGNKVNLTGKTRVSMDFRILPIEKYNPEYEVITATTSRKYVIGQYYELMSLKK